MDQQQFIQLLHVILNPSQGNIKQATSALQKGYYNDPESLLLLFQIAMSDQSSDLKQLAAVEARSLVPKHWVKIPAEQKPQIRERLLQSTVAESSALVRHSCARIISAIAEIDLNDGEWSELPQLLIQAATSSKSEERAVGTFVLFAILESLGESFQGKYAELFQLFDKTIRDPENPEVRINSLLALSKIAMHIDSSEDNAFVAAFQNIFPAMVNVLKDTIDQDDEARITQAFEVFHTVLSCDPELLNPHLKDLVIFINQIAANTEVSDDTRTQAFSFLMQTVNYRKLRVQGMRLGEQLTKTCLAVATELGDEDDDDDEITPARSALGFLDQLAQSLSPSQVVVPLLNSLGEYFNSSNPSHRRAGIMCLGMCVDGAPEFITTQIKEVFHVVVHLLQDSESSVRRAALDTMARLADDLTEDVRSQYEFVMPLLLKNLASSMQEFKGEESGPVVETIKSALSAIDSVIDDMEKKEVTQYLPELMPLLHGLLKQPNLKIREHTASALGSAASTAGEAFLPYFKDSMSLMHGLTSIKDSEEELELRASVIDAMGEISVGVGPEAFKELIRPLMESTEEALKLHHSRLKESSFLFWGVMSKVCGELFSPYLQGVFEGLSECIAQDETDLEVSLGESAKDLVGKEVTIGGHKVRVASADGDDDIEDLDAGSDVDWEDITTVTPVALEKEVAVEVLGDILTHAGKAIMPYFEKSIELILPLAEHSYEGVRKSTISTLHRAYAALWQIFDEAGQAQKWQPGSALIDPPAEIKKLGEILMKVTLELWAEEDDRSAVADINRNFADNLKYCGPYLITDLSTLEKVKTLVISIIAKQHPCQIEVDAEDGIEDGEISEFDWSVIGTALDVVGGLAIALGAGFVKIWPEFEIYILQFVSGSKTLERSSATGVLAEVITGIGNAVTPHTSKYLQVICRRLSDEDSLTRSNASYAIGRLVEKSDSNQEVIRAYPQILETLERNIQDGESRLPDNAAGALARLILKHGENVPLDTMLPLLVRALPLKRDYDENEPVYRMICQLYKREEPNVRDLTQQLLPIFRSVLTEDPDQLEDDRKTELIELVSWLNRMQPGGPAGWIEQLGQQS